ncbi:MAG: glycine cleavage system aminomethyltransferase GcvT [Candidatus Glassbacteria bacterium]
MNGLKRTPLYGKHVAAGARIVPFAGWEMPVSYGGILEEHNAVRTAAGLFDVSHMGRFRATGPGAAGLLDRATTGRVSSLTDGRFLYTVMLHEHGGAIDDLLVGRLGEEFIVVVNAANLDKDYNHLTATIERLGAEAGLTDESSEYALLALQGPQARRIMKQAVDSGGRKLDSLEYYHLDVFTILGEPTVVSRTGYTGELGYEIFIRTAGACALWDKLTALGAKPCGLGARDTLRLEMGYALYGHELDADHTPLEAGLGWVVDLGKPDFIGKPALVMQKERGCSRRLRGVKTSSLKEIPRAGYKLFEGGIEVAVLASGGPAPSVGVGIGTAFLPARLDEPGTRLEMELRGRRVPVTVVKPPFYKKGTAQD